MTDTEKNPQVNESLTGKNSVFNVEAQKEIIRFSFRQSLKMMLIVFPTIAIFVCALLYFVYKFLGVIK